jgi:hypothetical protein
MNYANQNDKIYSKLDLYLYHYNMSIVVIKPLVCGAAAVVTVMAVCFMFSKF